MCVCVRACVRVYLWEVGRFPFMIDNQMAGKRRGTQQMQEVRNKKAVREGAKMTVSEGDSVCGVRERNETEPKSSGDRPEGLKNK